MSNENESSSNEVAPAEESDGSIESAEGEASEGPASASEELASEEPASEEASTSEEASASEEPASQEAPANEEAPASEGASASEEVSASEAQAAADDEDRRRAYRLNKVLGATLTSLSGEAQAARLFVIDISCSGFRATDHQPHAEEQYDISVVLSKGAEPFRSRMRVVWTKELTVSGMFQMGCEFVDTPAEELDKLADFIDQERKRVEPAKPTVDLGRPWTMIR